MKSFLPKTVVKFLPVSCMVDFEFNIWHTCFLNYWLIMKTCRYSGECVKSKTLWSLKGKWQHWDCHIWMRNVSSVYLTKQTQIVIIRITIHIFANSIWFFLGHTLTFVDFFFFCSYKWVDLRRNAFEWS